MPAIEKIAYFFARSRRTRKDPPASLMLQIPQEVPMIQSFRDLLVWQKGMDLTMRVYGATEKFPRSEMFGLVSQMRRAAMSIPSNIAEGKAIGGLSYPRHLRIAHGSEAELQTQIELAQRLKLLGEAEASELLAHAAAVGRMLVSLRRSLPNQ